MSNNRAFAAVLMAILPITAQAAAIRAHDVVGALGVNTHLDFANYGYQNVSTVETNISYLGVKILRDSPQAATDALLWPWVANATGAKFDAYVAETSPAGMILDAGFFSVLNAAGILMAIEGGDEEDDSYPQSLGNTLAATAAFQQATMWLGGQALHLPVINMSFGAGWTAANNWQGNYGGVGDLSSYATWGNAHTYPMSGQTPSYAINYVNGLAKLAALSRPVATTEIGWDVSIFGQPTIAKFVLDAALDAALYGSPAMYFYGLYDDGSGAWGLFNADGTPRPAATALHNLTTLIADTGGTAATFTPADFAPALTGAISGDSSLLIAKSDGTYWLALWAESAAAGVSHNVTVTLPTKTAAVALYDPLVGTTAIQKWANVTSVVVPVSDHPTLLFVGAPTFDPTLTTTALIGPQITAPNSIGIAVGASGNVVGVSLADLFAAGNAGTLALNLNVSSGTIGTKDSSGNKLPGSDTASLALSLSWGQIAPALSNIYYSAPLVAGTAAISVNIWDQAGNQATQITKVIIHE
jgi:hypothetical protein